MGLFGYNKKDFNKNSGKIAKQLTDLLTKVEGKTGVEALLNKAILAVREMEYPKDAKGKKGGKQIEQIDERIFGLIEKLHEDLRQGKIFVMEEHTAMVFDAITKSRKYGREEFSPIKLRYKETFAQLNGDIKDTIKQKSEHEDELKRIENKSADLPEDSVEFEALEIQYERIEHNIAFLDKRLSKLCYYRDRLIESGKALDAYEEISNVISFYEEDRKIMAVEDLGRDR